MLIYVIYIQILQLKERNGLPMGKRKKRQKISKNILCIALCILVFSGTAEPSLGVGDSPPEAASADGAIYSVNEDPAIEGPADEYAAAYAQEGLQVQPLINMPTDSYEGHKVLISDESLYRIDGEEVNVKEVYAAGTVRSEFYVSDGSGNDADDIVHIHQGKCEAYQREAVFSEPGNYEIEMLIYCSDGRVLSKKQRIDIRKTPHTTSALAGAQKQNRLQRIDFRTAQNPSYPIKDIMMDITAGDGSESASVVFMKDGQAVNTIRGSENIKLHDAQNSVDDDKFFVTGNIELMSTFKTRTEFNYDITVTDTRDSKYVYRQTFTVETDKAPVAAMDLAESFIREENSDEAVITVEDISRTDGDALEREWYVKYVGEANYRSISGEPGYTDLSDGSGARVSFRKKGTGKFRVKLIVRDVWSEGTMDEYTSGEPRLSDTVERASEVVNTAPHVSIGAHSLKTADIVVLSNNDDDWSSLGQSFREKFLSQGVEARFSAEISDTRRADAYGSGIYAEKFQTESPFGYNGGNTAFENDLYIVDDSNLYYMEASWSDPADGGPEEPFQIIAADAESGKELWQYALKSDVFSLDTVNAHMYQDDTERYLYITSSGKTLVIRKSTGQPVTVADFEFGEYNFVYDNIIYTFTPDGIYSVSLSDGRTSLIWRGEMSGCARRIAGMPTTYVRTAQETILRLSLDTGAGKVTTKYVGKLPAELYTEESNKIGVKTALNVAGIDVNGRAVVEVNTPVYNENVNSSLNCYRAAIQVYDSDGTMIKQVVRSNDEPIKTSPVADKNGAYNYFAVIYSQRRAVKAEVNGITNDYSSSLTLTDSNGRPACYDRIIYSCENYNEVSVTLGGICAWIYGQTWATGDRHGTPERCTNVSFNLTSGTAAETALPAGCTGFSEYARRSELYTVIHSGRNSQYAGYAKTDNTVTKRSQSVYEMLYRAMKKDLRTDSDADYRILLLKNLDAGVMSGAEADELGRIATSAGYRIYIAYDDRSISQLMIPDAEYLTHNEDLAEVIAEDAAADGIKDHRYTSVEVSKDPASLTRTFALKNDRKYYFEYNVKADTEPSEPVSVSHSILPVLDDKTYKDGALYVTGAEKEDFNDDDLNGFFTYDNYDSAGGMYTDCYAARDGSANLYIEKDSEISFEIPDGKEGVLSFDYVIFNPQKGDALNANYAEIDGERWNAAPGTTGRGGYIHPDVLKSGKHTLKLHTSSYGSKMINYTYVDNLKLSYISTERSDSDKAFAVSDSAISGRSAGVYKITGSFATPGEATVYREMNDVEYVAAKAGDAAYTRLDASGTDGDRYFYIELPDGKTAVSPSVVLKTSCSSSYSVSYDMGNFPEAIYYGTLKNEGNRLFMIEKTWKYILPSLSGKHTFSTYADSYRKTSGAFDDVEMYVTGGANILTDRNRYVKSENKAGEKTLFLAENGYGDKTEIKIDLDRSVREIYDFRLYTIEDGKKMYVSENDFSDRATADKWTAENASIKYEEYSSDDTTDIPIFSKGQYVDYNVTYWDYEGDPSKISYWKYTHTPYNDGPLEQASTVLDRSGNILSEKNIILNEPITRFYRDGKYTVEHWQEDDTTRGAAPGGDPAYDKESNHVFITFYVGGIEDAPWIRYIKTIPSDIYEGDNIGLQIEVDDAKKSVLTLETDVYRGDELIYTGRIQDITPHDGRYEPVVINGVKNDAECGIYKVICSVSSDHGTGADSIKFTVMSRGNIEGTVYHTDKWDENRKFAGRDKDTFWPGERLMLKADTEGSPTSVTAWIEGEEDERCELSPAENGVYRGSIWSEDMMFRWGAAPTDKKIIFRADYKNGTVKMSEYNITFDNSRLYWNIHKTQGA